MVFNKLKEALASNTQPATSNLPTILVVEDDIDQLDMLTEVVLTEIREIAKEPTLDGDEQLNLRSIKVAKVTNAQSLLEAVNSLNNIILVILDCNIPDSKTQRANDQFVTNNHKITGQHKSVDTVIAHAPNTELLLISSMKRFKRMVLRYYKTKHDLQLKFVDKTDVEIMMSSIRVSIQHFLKKQP